VSIAVIGGDGVGKSTFMQRALDLPFLSPIKVADRKMTFDGTVYRIRLLEISIDDVDIDDNNTVSWQNVVADGTTPHIEGVLTLYNVADRRSLEDVPETLRKLLAYIKKAL
jgi:GTPase SAR1 family protein